MKTMVTLGLLMLSACGTLPPQSGIREISLSGGSHTLVSTEPRKSLSFYQDLLNWNTFELTQNLFWLIENEEHNPVGGVLQMPSSESPRSAWISTFDVPDLDATLERIRQKGGEVTHGPAQVRSGWTVAMIRDPQGASLQVRETQESSGFQQQGPWIWHEAVTSTPAASAAWYAEVFALEVVEKENRFFLMHNGKAIAGVSLSPFEESAPQWVPVLEVPSLEPVLANVSQLDGNAVLKTETLALVQDPQHAVLFLQQVEGSE